MIIAFTTLMLVALLMLMPLRLRVDFCLNFARKNLRTRVRMFFLPVFNEQFSLEGAAVQCSGSVDTSINLPEIDPANGKHYVKAIVVDSVNVTVAVNYLAHSPFTMLAVESCVFGATLLGCLATNCRVRTHTQMSSQTAVFGQIRLSTTLVNVFIAIIRSRHAS